MISLKEITLPSSFVDVLNALDEDVAVEDIERMIIAQATSTFDAKWGSIKYYYGNQFINGDTTVPPEYRIKPRKKGFAYKTVNNDQPHILTEKVLRKAHPEAHPDLKSIMLSPLRLDATTVATVTMFDVKDREDTAELIQRLRDFGCIYGRVLKMAHKFAAEKKALSNRDKFMSFAAHELKNPLQALVSYNYLIKRSLDKNKKIEPEWLDKITGEINRMNLLINELLDIKQSQDGAFKFALEKISLQKLLKQVSDNFTVRNPGRKLLIDHQFVDGDTVMGDEIKLNQVFINLLNNAHKFSEVGTAISIKSIENNSFFEITIQDQGMGIPIEEQPYIFKEFYRGSNGEDKKGIGVGLFLVKSIVDGHNGKIEVESHLGKGSTFKVYLPKYQSI